MDNSGERTASALENNLTDLEEKIEALLAAVENPKPRSPPNSTGRDADSSIDQTGKQNQEPSNNGPK